MASEKMDIGSSLAGLLQRADDLSTRIDSARSPGEVLPTPSQGGGARAHDHQGTLMLTDRSSALRDINQIFKIGENLWESTASQNSATEVSQKQDEGGVSLVAPSKVSDSSGAETDLESFLRKKRENLLQSLIQETFARASEDSEREHWKWILREEKESKERLMSSGPMPRLQELLHPQSDGSVASRVSGSPSAMDPVQVTFAQKVATYVENKNKDGPSTAESLGNLFSAASKSLKENGYWPLWEQVECVLRLPGDSGSDPLWRDSSQFRLGLIHQASSCLERQFRQHMETVIYEHLTEARLGGVPGTRQKVSAYAKLTLPLSRPADFEDGTVDGFPVWPMLLLCLRAGDAPAAAELAARAQPALAEFLDFFLEYADRDGNLSPDTETKLRLQYRRSGKLSRDPWKRAVMCILAPCDPKQDHPEVATKLEDWLWMRLLQARHGERRSEPEYPTLSHLQLQISEQYGEEHFSGSESPLTFWTLLWLTGQWELGLEFLFRQTTVLRTHAVHVALALHDSGLLATPRNLHAPLCSQSPTDPKPLRRLNLPRMLLLYTTPFEDSDTRTVLDYLFFLKNFKTEKGENLFAATVCDVALRTKEIETVLGRRDEDGRKQPGLIQRFRDFRPEEITEFVASRCKTLGQLDLAVRLYDLADEQEKVLELLNGLLSEAASAKSAGNSERERVRRLALCVASRYRRLGHRAPEATAATFFLLLDILTFFDLFHAPRHREALDMMRTLAVIPLSQDQVDAALRRFPLVPQEVRRLLSDILLAVMSILQEEHSKAKLYGNVSGWSERLEETRGQGKALVLFAGLIPYRLPADTNAKLVQMEVQLHC